MRKSILTFLGEVKCKKDGWRDLSIDRDEHRRQATGDAKAYCARGYANSSFGDFEGALVDFSRAIELDSEYVEAYVTRGLVRIVLGDYSGAVRDSGNAIEIDPEYAEAYATRGLARRNLADYKGAIRDLDRAIETNSVLCRKHCKSGFAKSGIGDYAGAIDDFNRAIELYPNYADIHFIRGITNIALQSFYDVMEVKPGYFFTYYDRDYREHTRSYSLAYFGRGLAKSSIHDYRGAIEDYNYSILLSPELPVIYRRRGLVKCLAGDYVSAVRDFNKASELDAAGESAAAAGFSYPELLHPGAEGMRIHT
ncbi:MAG TPA: tetratricopeptide repeat protein [Thermodesulfobacteriota bacterium]|nr:tetratricopeptide repeat protein [Thermodesulfobacteriota bacterium]